MQKTILIENILTRYTFLSSEYSSPTTTTMARLHGRQQQGSTFFALAKQFPTYNHLFIDLPGFGATDLPPLHRGVPEYTVFTEKCLRALVPTSSYILIGHSFGCRIIIELVAKKNILPSHIILIGAAGIQEHAHASSSKKYIIQCLKKVFRFLKLQNVYESIARHFRSTDYNNAGILTHLFMNTIQYDQRNLFPHIKTPTLLLRGDNDQETPVSHAHYMHNTIPQSSLYIFPGSHFVYLEQPTLIINAITSFIGSYA